MLAYRKLFELFVTANAIDWLIISLLHGLVSLDLPKDKLFSELVDILKKHYNPEPIVIAKRFHFFQHSQKSGESIGDSLVNLRWLASHLQNSSVFCTKHYVIV